MFPNFNKLYVSVVKVYLILKEILTNKINGYIFVNSLPDRWQGIGLIDYLFPIIKT